LRIGRAIYGAVFGFPGGIAWAIMVARICQLYPMACGATILAKFFNLMHKWNWPRPVMLKDHELPEYGLRVWNPAVSSPVCNCKLQLMFSRYTVETPGILCPS
jgi:poly(A) polymerase